MDIYRTITSASEAVFTEKRSKFLGFAFPVETVEEVKTLIADISKKYFDARHVCYAYMLGHERKEFRANDNGEPSGTAGKPILGQINSLELTNVLVVVVRYFGGIKLGTSGLIAAYRQAARDTLENAEVVERHIMQRISFAFSYEAMNDAMKITRLSGVRMVASSFDNICVISIDVEADRTAAVVEQINKISGVSII